jgi:microsomal dipeptidase-like Zn-dependent dipeptidase
MSFVLVISACVTTPSSTSPSTITIQKPVHFTASDGADVVASARVYQVERVTDTTMRLVPQEGKDPLVIQAQTTKYDEPTSGSLALSIPYQEDEHHVLLLMPDGNALDATGTYSGVKSRAATVAPLSAPSILQYQRAATPVLAPVKSQPTLPSLSLQVPSLSGWVDLHTHLMSNLAFGGKLFHGAPDAGSLLPAVQMPYDPQCRFDVRANSMEEALSDDAPTHGDNFQSKCGSALRKSLIWAAEEGSEGQPGHRIGAVFPPGAVNPPPFGMWPKWNDIDHQKMYVDWIRRAKDGGLRVMVALSHNNRLLGEVAGPGNFTPSAPGMPISGPTDDMHSSDLQVAEIKAFVFRHSDFMEVALTAADVSRIVQANKIAIILGVEIDNIGNFNQLPPGLLQNQPGIIQAEIQRLYSQGVRYIFPIHVTDNVFGDTAIYDAKFNASNFRETGSLWRIECALPPAPPFPGDDIGFTLPGSSSLGDFLLAKVNAGLPIPPTCPQSGHRNGRTPTGLTPSGEFAIRAMMKLGMIIDIDHMSQRAAERALQIAEGIPGGGYPLMSGHSAIRGQHTEFNAENSRTRTQLQRIACLQGMFGLGTGEADAYVWAREYADAFNEMSKAFAPTSQCPNKVSFGPGIVALGTDMNSLVKAPRPTMGPDLKPGSPIRAGLYNAPGFPTSRSSAGGKTWDYNLEGVAHYGMLADFLKDVRTAPVNQGISGADVVDNHFMRSADYFWRMWQKIEAQKSRVP